MAKTKEQIYEEEIALLNGFLGNNDYKGMYLYMEENFRELRNVETEETNAKMAAWETYLEDLATANEPAYHQFARNFAAFGGQRVGELMADAGLQTDQLEQHLLNGELEGAEHLTATPKYIRNAAVGLNTNTTEIGRKQSDVWALNQHFLLPLRIKGKTALDQEYSQLRDEAGMKMLNDDPRVSEENKKRYAQELSGQALNDIFTDTSQGRVFQDEYYVFSNEAGGPLFSSVPEFVIHLKGLNDEELEQYKQELISNRDIMSAYIGAGKEWAGKAGELEKELEEKTPPDQKNTDAYRQLKEALALNATFGEPNRTYTVPGSQEEKDATDVTQEVFADYSSILKTAAEAFPDKELGAKILNASKEAGQKLEQCYAAGVQNVRDKASNYAESRPKSIEEDIRRVQAEQDLRALKTDPRGKELTALQDKIRSCSSLQSEINLFKDSVRKSLYRCDFQNEALQKDAAGRNIAEKDKREHSEYFTLVDNFNSLKDMDMSKLSPSQILDKLKAVKSAGERYENTHSGLRNFTKAWSSEGRGRLNMIRSVTETLDKQIKALEPKVKALEEKTGKEALGNKFAKLEEEKTALRGQAAAVKADILTPVDQKIENRIQGYRNQAAGHAATHKADLQNDKKFSHEKMGTMYESAAKVAADSMKSLHQLSQSKEPLTKQQQEEALSHIARTVCYDKEMFSKDKNKTEEEYKQYVKPFETGAFFKDSVKETLGDLTPESLKKFCSQPTLSSSIAEKASEKKFGKQPTIHVPKKKTGPVVEENKEKAPEGPQP